MPLFNKKFETKPIPLRTGRCNSTGFPIINEELEDYKSITLSLGSKELAFTDGIWINSTRKGDIDDVTRLNRQVKKLQEENNMSTLKIEVLLDLLAEQATELAELKDA